MKKIKKKDEGYYIILSGFESFLDDIKKFLKATGHSDGIDYMRVIPVNAENVALISECFDITKDINYKKYVADKI